MISFKQHGDLKKTYAFLEKMLNLFDYSLLDVYGKKGVEALQETTPKKTGKTSQSWYYEIEETPKGVSLSWKNSNVQKGVNIALLIQYGHGTKEGAYIEGRDYINPAIQPLFDEMAESIFKEVDKS